MQPSALHLLLMSLYSKGPDARWLFYHESMGPIPRYQSPEEQKNPTGPRMAAFADANDVESTCRDLVQRVTRVEEVAAAEVATMAAQKERVQAEIDSSRADFKRQVGLMDIMNAQHKEIVAKYEGDIDILEVRGF